MVPLLYRFTFLLSMPATPSLWKPARRVAKRDGILHFVINSSVLVAPMPLLAVCADIAERTSRGMGLTESPCVPVSFTSTVEYFCNGMPSKRRLLEDVAAARSAVVASVRMRNAAALLLESSAQKVSLDTTDKLHSHLVIPPARNAGSLRPLSVTTGAGAPFSRAAEVPFRNEGSFRFIDIDECS